MFVVVQEVSLKKPDPGGEYKEYEVSSTTFSFGGKAKTHYSYYPKYDAGRFERLQRKAYKITLRQSYRENGKVKAKQCVLGTVGYYILAEGKWGLYDYVESGLRRAADMFGDIEDVYELVESKIKPIQQRIQREFRKTEEYKATKERDRLQKRYQKAKADFAKRYGVDEDEYDYCYNVFGEVMNQAHLDEIIQQSAFYSSYRENSYGNYSYGGEGYSKEHSRSYFNVTPSTYTVEEKRDLKKFYKSLALQFHPDTNPSADSTQTMQLLNKLKDEWGI